MGGDKSTASDSAIPGGGVDDPTHSDGAIALTRPDAKNYRVDRHRLKALKNQLEQMIHTDPALNNMSFQLKIDLVPDGLRVQIFDNRQRPMFEPVRALDSGVRACPGRRSGGLAGARLWHAQSRR